MSMALRICMISRDFWPSIGGIAAHVLGLSRALAGLGCEVSVVAPSTQKRSESTHDSLGVPVIWVPQTAGRKNPAIFEFAIRASTHILQEGKKFDVVHWHDLWADPCIARCVRAPVRIFTNHSSGFVTRVQSPRWRTLFRLWHPRPSAIIAPSQELADLSKETFHGVPAHFLSNGVDTERFIPHPKNVELLRKLGISERAFVILVPRRLQNKNGVENAIRALPELKRAIPDLACVLAGSGEMRSSLERLACELGVSGLTHFVGPLPNSEMLNFYSSSDLVLVPSFIEATSIAILEAMACGKPVVASRVGGIPHLVAHDQTGFLVPPGDHRAIAAAVRHVYDHPPLMRAMGKRARCRTVEQFSWPSIAEKVVDLYEFYGRVAPLTT